MTVTHVVPDGTETQDETEQARVIRVRREAEVLAAARVEVDSGGKVTWTEAKAWLIARERDPLVQAPKPTRAAGTSD